MVYPRALPRYLAGLGLALCMMPVHAQQPDVYQTLTADDLLGSFLDGRLAAWVEDPAHRTMLSTSMGTAYVLGTADSVKGEAWCPQPDARIQAFTEVVLDYLADLPEARLSENAAKIVAEGLGKAYPCPR